MAAFGLTREDVAGEAVEVWPDNVQAVDVFVSMDTQWRVSHAGLTGLDYSALESVMRVHGVKRSARADVFDAVRLMESEALRVMRDK